MFKISKRAKIIATVSLVLVVVLFFVASNKKDNVEVSNLQVITQSSDSVINPENPKEIVGFSDYYFIGRVEEVVNTEYRNVVTIETEDGDKEVADPYTHYKISVIKNIKGELPLDKDIQLTKSGGMLKDESAVVLYEDDILPEEGKVYVIAANIQKDGEILASGPNTVQEVNINTMSSQEDEAYKIYEYNYENEIPYERQRFEPVY